MSKIQQQQQQHATTNKDQTINAKIEALSAQFQALLKQRNGNAIKIILETATTSSEAAETTDAAAEAATLWVTTCAVTAKNQDTCKKFATLGSRLGLWRSMRKAYLTCTQMSWTPRTEQRPPDPPFNTKTHGINNNSSYSTGNCCKKSTQRPRILSKRQHCTQK